MNLFRAALILHLCAAAQASETIVYDGEIVCEKDVMISMRDGVRLATDIYRLAVNGQPVQEQLPLILNRTPTARSARAPWRRPGSSASRVT